MSQWIVREFPRPSAEALRGFRSAPTGIICDCMNRFQCMDAGIRPLRDDMRICGTAITVQAFEGCNWGAHQALTLARSGDVLVIAANGSLRSAVWGHVLTTAALKLGIEGVVIDGCIRDAEENRGDSFPIFSRGICPGGPHKGWPCNLNVAVACGGVPVLPGDIIVGDADGVVVIPRGRAEEVLGEISRRIDLERDWYTRLENGESTVSLLGMKPV